MTSMYTPEQRILVLGDGNLTFSRALLKSMGGRSAGSIVATSLHDSETVRQRYPETNVIGDILAQKKCGITFAQINAEELPNLLETPHLCFDRVVWNFPYPDNVVGGSETPTMIPIMNRFFARAQCLLAVDGQMHVTFCNAQVGRWRILAMAQKHALKVTAKAFDDPFWERLGYIRRQGTKERAWSMRDPVTLIFEKRSAGGPPGGPQLTACAGEDFFYLCIEAHLVPQVLRQGFNTRARENAAVATNRTVAERAYRQYHTETGQLLRVRVRPDNAVPLTPFRNDRGCWRIQGRHIPAAHLSLI